ncbi:MAG: hypothetical protein P4L45_04970 [Ignavibacteriaceae bacterium]|nr:hypothetical protein [Ignavibacteriaceae bacterium]
MDIQNDKDMVRKIIQIINGAWLNNHLELLNDYFDDQMVITTRDLKQRAAGRDACIMSYKQFIETADLLEYKQDEPVIELWKTTAVAFYNFEITYKTRGVEFTKKGEDIFVFSREEENDNYWKAIWRRVSDFNS